jgi:hypothetical protein
LEPVAEERLQLLTVSRISRVKKIEVGDRTISEPAAVAHDPSKTRAEIEEARRLYLQSYMKQLP